MERSLFSTLISSLLGISTLGSLALAGFTGSPAPEPPGRPEGDWRLLEPVGYENISIFPVVSGSTQDTGGFLTLDEGLATGEVVVAERGTEGMARSRDGRVVIPDYDRRTGAAVNQLVLVNRSKRPLLLLAGELVSGGKQDRIIGKDRIVPVGAPPLPLDVFCVEHGRWSNGSQFAAAKMMVHPSVREKAAVDQKQEEVWSAVRGGTTYDYSSSSRAAGAAPPVPPPSARITPRDLSDAMAGPAPTQSYQKIYAGSRVGQSIDSFVNEVQARFARATSGLKGEHVVGVVVAYGGEVAWSDIFASGHLFDHYWNKLLRSYAVEAMARPTFREVASRDSASDFLRRLSGREIQESEPGVYRWREITDGRFALIELESIEPKPMTVHRLFLHRT
jgi:ARG/rhodanese/phosphatase superfamily protein